MDYKKIGFKCGIEIHQQLDTLKLFCNCPSIVRDNNPDITVKRKLRAVAGESGNIDQAATYEKGKEKTFIYEACSSSCCLVELDEEPPHQVNQDALLIALEVALHLNAKIVDDIQFMRKTVIDGSNVSGFQRTALIAQDGYIETSKGKVLIPTICLEEEAAKKIETTKTHNKYRLDRLGIPLIEIATDPDIQDADHAKETAEKLGMILRSTKKVKRGLGTIRQDVNVSIKGGVRVEIKGFQDLKSIPKVITNEINRQLIAIKKGDKLKQEVRKAESNFSTTFLRPMPGADRMYPETDIRTIKITKEFLDSIELSETLENKAKKLNKYNLANDVSKKIVSQHKEGFFIDLFDNLKNLKPTFIVDTFSSVHKELEKDFKIKDVSDNQIKQALTLVNDNKVPKSNLNEALADITKNKLDLNKFKGADDSDLEDYIKQILKDKPGLNPGAYMGLIMQKFKGKVDGKKAMALVNKNSK